MHVVGLRISYQELDACNIARFAVFFYLKKPICISGTVLSTRPPPVYISGQLKPINVRDGLQFPRRDRTI